MKNFTFHHNIKFWIILFFVIRLIGITNPPIERGHNWRQSTGLMVARNFVEVDNNILYPRVDDNKAGTGITGMEFPILNYLIYVISVVFGYTHWYGRLINLIISSIGLLFFYKLIAKYFTDKHAFVSTLILIASIWFSFSRKTMPDTFCISLILIAIFYGLKYIEKGGVLNLLLYTFIGLSGILAKIPAGIYLGLFIFPILLNSGKLKRKILLSIITVAILAVVYWWYFVWNVYLSSNFGTWYNSGKDIITGFNEIINNLGQTLKRFYFSAFQSYLVLGLFLAGIFLMFKHKKRKLLAVSLSIFIIFIIYIFKSGFFFYHHNYYIIPFVPIMALVAGYPLTLIKNKKIFIAILAIGILEGIANQQQDFFMKNKERHKLELENIADSFSNKDDLIAINGNGNPQQIYLTHRKGWTLSNKDLSNSDLINQIKLKGCKYLFVNKKGLDFTLEKKKVFSNEFYDVYKL